jgi:hypothetical protein
MTGLAFLAAHPGGTVLLMLGLITGLLGLFWGVLLATLKRP